MEHVPPNRALMHSGWYSAALTNAVILVRTTVLGYDNLHHECLSVWSNDRDHDPQSRDAMLVIVYARCRVGTAPRAIDRKAKAKATPSTSLRRHTAPLIPRALFFCPTHARLAVRAPASPRGSGRETPPAPFPSPAASVAPPPLGSRCRWRPQQHHQFITHATKPPKYLLIPIILVLTGRDLLVILLNLWLPLGDIDRGIGHARTAVH